MRSSYSSSGCVRNTRRRMDLGMMISRFEFKIFENLNKSANVKVAGTLYPAIRITRTDSPI